MKKQLSQFRRFFKVFAKDEDGVMMTEYVILLATLVVATIWLNKSADTLLFGADPEQRTGNPQLSDDKITEGDNSMASGNISEMNNAGISGLAKTRMEDIGNNGKKKAYLSQVYIHLSRP